MRKLNVFSVLLLIISAAMFAIYQGYTNVIRDTRLPVLTYDKDVLEVSVEAKPEELLPGGEAIGNGSELLGTEMMHRIIKHMEQKVDYVILDSAPAGLLTDAVVLSQYADGAVFVTRKDFASVEHIMDGMEHLASSQIQIIGGILNGV